MKKTVNPLDSLPAALLVFVALMLATPLAARAELLYGNISSQGQPVSNATITAIDTGNQQVAGSDVSDENGNYSLEVPQGTYNLEVVAPAGLNLQELTLLNVVVAGDTIQNIILLPTTTPVQLSGRVLDRYGAAVAGVYVYVYAGTGNSFMITGLDGSYSLATVAGDNYLNVSGNYLSPNLPDNFSRLEVLTLTQDSVHDVVLQTVVISGFATDQLSQPVPGVLVDVNQNFSTASGGYYSANDQAMTDNTGFYQLVLFNDTEAQGITVHSVRATPPSGNGFPPSVNTAFGQTLTEDRTLNITLNRDIRVALSGRVLDRDLVGVENVYVNVSSASGTSASTLTGAGGSYQLQGFLGDNYLNVSGNYLSPNLPDNFSRLEVLTLTQDSVHDVVLQTVVLSGFATDQLSQPVPGVLVDVNQNFSTATGGYYSANDQAMTDNTGFYQLVLFNDTEAQGVTVHSVRATPPIGNGFPPSVNTPFGQTLTEDRTLNITLNRDIRVALSGRVLDRDLVGVENVYVNVSSASGSSASTITGAGGSYQLLGFLGDNYLNVSGNYLSPNLPDNFSRLEVLTLTQDSVHDVVLQTVVLSGFVTDQYSQPVAGVRVQVNQNFFTDDGDYYSANGEAQTAANGFYRLVLFNDAEAPGITVGWVNFVPPGGSGFPPNNPVWLGQQLTVDTTLNVAFTTGGIRPASADLEITKNAFPIQVQSGAQITYTLTVHNHGPDSANSVSITDLLPAATTFVSCTATGGGVCSGEDNNRTITFVSLPAGATETVTLVAQVNSGVAEGSDIPNTAGVSASTSDPDSSNNSASVTVRVPFSNQPPTANAGLDQLVSAGSGCDARVTLDGSRSDDPDHDTLSYTWTGSFGMATGVNPIITLPLGRHTISLLVDDYKGGTASDTVDIEVRDTTAPVINCPANLGANTDFRFPVIHGFSVQEVAQLPGPVPLGLSVSSAGYIYVGLLGDVGTHIYRIPSNGGLVETYGPALDADPQAILVDELGIIGPPGTVLTGTYRLEGILSNTQKIDLSNYNQSIFAYAMDFAPSHDLLIASAHTAQWGVYRAASDGPHLLFGDSCACGFYHVLAGPDGKIYASRSNGTIALADALGQIIQSDWASGMGDIVWTDFAPGGSWGEQIYGAANSTGNIYKIDANGQSSLFASGFEHIQVMKFGPDGALYIGVRPSGRILKISPSNLPLECNTPTDPSITGHATATDNCDGAPIITYVDSETPGDFLDAKMITRTWTATDSSGNRSSCVQTIRIQDSAKPLLAGVPANVKVECDAVPAPATPTATDNCNPNPVISFTEVRTDGNCANNYTLTRTWTATDRCGNINSQTQVVSVSDTFKPVLIGVPGNASAECDAVPAAATPTATDNCDPNPVITFSEVRTDGNCADNYTLTRTWTATDRCGNINSQTQVVSVSDIFKPVLIGVPGNASAECDAVPAAATPTATDNCDPNPVITFSEVRTDGNCADNYTLTRTWTATDRCGNINSQTQVVSVSDIFKPVLIGVPGNASAECDAVPAAATPTATDNCDPNPVITFSEVRTDGNCADNYTLTRTWTATDRCGNINSQTQVVSVSDTSKPVLAGVPGNAAAACDAVPATATPTATDNCDPNPVITFIEVRTDGNCVGNYTLTRTWIVTDRCGNSSSATQVITVRDITPPVASCPPNIVTGTDLGLCSAVVTFAATATDNCGPASVVCNPPSGSVFPKGATTVTCTATDQCGNSSQCTFTVTVNDTEPPAITCPADRTVSNDPGLCTATVDPGVATATDNCPGVTVTGLRSDGLPLTAPYPQGTTTITWTATDAVGLTAQCAQSVKVNDTEAPAVACTPTTNPAGGTVPKAGDNPRSGQNPDGFYQLTAGDNCPGDFSAQVFVCDTANPSICFGPFASGAKVKITQAPGVRPNMKPMAGVIVAHIQLNGDALIKSTDASGNTGTHICRVAPPPK